MSIIVRLYAILSAISRWVEDMRIALLVRFYGMANDEGEPPIPWRIRERLPSHDQWPMVNRRVFKVTPDQATESERILGSSVPTVFSDRCSVWLVGKRHSGPVRPVPMKDKEVK